MTSEDHAEHYFGLTYTARATITVVKGEPSEAQLRSAAATAIECLRAGDPEGALGWRVESTQGDILGEQYWDDEFDADEHDLVVDYYAWDLDEETYRV
jgi:hypothetical protein